MSYKVLLGDCRKRLGKLADNSIDSIVTDPPYELGFMGKSWDSTGVAYDVAVWQECLRVLKPGGHLLAFGGSRTYHRLAVAIEDAGFQIRDQIMWVYGSGFPKSLDVSKAIDKQAGAERQVLSEQHRQGRSGGILGTPVAIVRDITAPATDAKKWQGWGTALKPAHEPIVLARKPLDGTVANNVLTHGVGGINIDGCRVEYSSNEDKTKALAGDAFKRKDTSDKGWSRPWMDNKDLVEKLNREAKERADAGRFPANFIHDGSDEVLELFPLRGHNDSSSAARFFYCAKANKTDRNEGLDKFNAKFCLTMGNGIGGKEHDLKTATKKLNYHPTVKPTDLMRYLCRLVTPPNGIVLDPFTGSGSTGKAAMLEKFNFIGIEQDKEYIKIARTRIKHAQQQARKRALVKKTTKR